MIMTSERIQSSTASASSTSRRGPDRHSSESPLVHSTPLSRNRTSVSTVRSRHAILKRRRRAVVRARGRTRAHVHQVSGARARQPTTRNLASSVDRRVCCGFASAQRARDRPGAGHRAAIHERARTASAIDRRWRFLGAAARAGVLASSHPTRRARSDACSVARDRSRA